MAQGAGRPVLSVTPHKQATKQRTNHQGNTRISSNASQFLPTHGQDPKGRALSQHSISTPVPNRTAEFIASKQAPQANQRRRDQKQQGPYLDRGGRRRGAAGSRRCARGREEAGDDDGRSEIRRRRTQQREEKGKDVTRIKRPRFPRCSSALHRERRGGKKQ